MTQVERLVTGGDVDGYEAHSMVRYPTSLEFVEDHATDKRSTWADLEGFAVVLVQSVSAEKEAS